MTNKEFGLHENSINIDDLNLIHQLISSPEPRISGRGVAVRLALQRDLLTGVRGHVSRLLGEGGGV